MKIAKRKFRKGDWVIGSTNINGNFPPYEARKIIFFKKIHSEYMYYDPTSGGKKGKANNGNTEKYLRLATKTEITQAKKNGA